jgi:hypothetical protein
MLGVSPALCMRCLHCYCGKGLSVTMSGSHILRSSAVDLSFGHSAVAYFRGGVVDLWSAHRLRGARLGKESLLACKNCEKSTAISNPQPLSGDLCTSARCRADWVVLMSIASIRSIETASELRQHSHLLCIGKKGGARRAVSRIYVERRCLQFCNGYGTHRSCSSARLERLTMGGWLQPIALRSAVTILCSAYMMSLARYVREM